MDPKEAAARRAVSEIRDGMNVGFGSGRTVDLALDALGERVREGLRVRLAVASSRSEARARAAGLAPEDPDTLESLDLLIDGADEIGPGLSLIKGGGAALVREKLLAVMAREFVVVADAVKQVPFLGAFPLPVAVVPFAAAHTARRLGRYCAGPVLRVRDGRPCVTDDGLWIVDLRCERIDDPAGLEARIKAETGVVEVGLFVHLASRALLGLPDGTVREIHPSD